MTMRVFIRNIAGDDSIARCIIFGVPRLPIRPCDERPPAMYGHFCLVPRVSVHDRYYIIVGFLKAHTKIIPKSKWKYKQTWPSNCSTKPNSYTYTILYRPCSIERLFYVMCHMDTYTHERTHVRVCAHSRTTTHTHAHTDMVF